MIEESRSLQMRKMEQSELAWAMRTLCRGRFPLVDSRRLRVFRPDGRLTEPRQAERLIEAFAGWRHRPDPRLRRGIQSKVIGWQDQHHDLRLFALPG
jgi:hypothetical protein